MKELYEEKEKPYGSDFRTPLTIATVVLTALIVILVAVLAL